MKNAEREQLQRRFAEIYVEKAAGLWVQPSELINGVRSSIGSEAVKESGYPHDYFAGQVAQALTRNPKVNSWIKQLATDRLQTIPEDKRPLALIHLAKYGRLSMPDYETMASNLSVTVDELKQRGNNHASDIVAYYHRARSEAVTNKRLEAMSVFLSAEELAELRQLHSEYDLLESARFTPHASKVRTAIESRQEVVRQKIDSLEAVADDKAELAKLEPKIADGSIFDSSQDIGRAIARGFDIEAIIEGKKAELVKRFGAELGPELEDLLHKYSGYLNGRSWASMGFRLRRSDDN